MHTIPYRPTGLATISLPSSLDRSSKSPTRSYDSDTRTRLTPHQEGDPKPKSYAQANASVASTDGASSGVGLYAVVLVGAALAFAAYTYLQSQQGEQ